MLTTYLKRQTTLATYYTSSAGPYLDEFTDWLAQCGFHDEVICQYLPGVSEFAAWVDATYGNLTSFPVNALNHFHDYLATLVGCTALCRVSPESEQNRRHRDITEDDTT
jgi:hypothetical protein